MSLAKWIGVGVAGGLVTGILVGKSCAVLQPVGKAYVMLLQSVVYPYLISSLLHGLGRLSPKVALKLLKKSWPFYLLAWGSTFGAIYLLSLAFPAPPPPLSLDATLPARGGPDFLQLVLPGNIFRDLASNYVPAVVTLSVLFGVAIQGVQGKERLLEILAMVRTACVKIWNWVVLMAPFAVFAMFASTAGTIDMAHAGGLAVYAGLFLIGAGLLAFFAIPALISSLIPVRYREVLGELREGLTLSLVTTLSVVSLPYIQRAAEKLAKANGIEDKDSGEIIETSLAVNYPLGQLGNFFVFFFILFLCFYARTPLGFSEQLTLPLMTLFSCFGSPTSSVNAVDFLGHWLRLPGHPADLYVETMMVTRYGQVALSVMGFTFLTFLMTFNFYGKTRPRIGKMAGVFVVLAVCLAGMAFGGHAMLSRMALRPHHTYLNLTMPKEISEGIDAKFYKSREAFIKDNPHPALKPGQSVFGRIQSTQTLRVGYGRDMAPFAFFNNKGQLAGYDVACAYDLARALNVKLVFVPVDFRKVRRDVEQGVMDIWVGGVYVMEYRMMWADYSRSYYHSPMALIVPSWNIDSYLKMARIKQDPNFRLAIIDNQTMHILAHRLFPKAKRVELPSYNLLAETKNWSAALSTMEECRVWAAAHPGYTAVRPLHMGAVVLFAYMMHKESGDMLKFVDHWLRMRKADGFLERQRVYWIDGAVPG